jgi:hypothetical protein
MINRKEQGPMDKTYRFWITHNGRSVRLSLKVGQSIDLHSGGPTEEGYHRASHVYYIDREKGVLIGEHWWEGSDCDGRMSGGGDNYAELNALEAKPQPWIYSLEPTPLERQEREGRPVSYPDWQRLDRWQRDYQGEAAGF